MPKTTKPLSDIEVKSAKPKEKEYNLADGNGLALRVKPTGSKNWIFNYQHPISKKRNNLGFGTYPDVTLARAREKRANARNLLDHQIDPKAHYAEQLKIKQDELACTFEVITQEWFELKLSKVKQATADKHMEMLENHVLPKLGKQSVKAIIPSQVIDILRPLEAKGSLETVKRLCRVINEIMILALNTGKLERNNLEYIGKSFISPTPKKMATITPDRLPELMQKLATSNLMRITRCLVEWQLHTMTRPSETAMAEWHEIDFQNNLWVIPAKRMKRNREHSVPLTPQTLNLLEILKQLRGNSPYLFPSHRGRGKHANVQTANMALKRIGYSGELVSHGLRALASTALNEQRFDADLIEVCLAHVDKNSVRNAYNRSDYLERRRKIMGWWSDHIEQAAIGNMSLANAKQTLRAV
ncbi:integrase domain-containing protein [Alteromonas oceanisediminis]|uniref:integrase domain-containing protein n=1 Tax=Alteromonas oceanisediminis TaxID=2836180 RepID=UPI001BDA6C47|nr:integrase domain-containing protein [Alteromonas oceanisediminis]MBT0585109.1 tyrosine-type recombinase/integrase [Alteromonas oceanisediminis]